MKRTRHLSQTKTACRIGGPCRCLTVLLLALLVLGWPADVTGQDVEAKYKDYFFHFQDNRSISEKALNLVGLTRQDVGRSVALIAGVYQYPNLTDNLLVPAAIDIGKMKSYLKDYEFFDEIIVLENEAVTLENLQYFFQDYIPRRVAAPKSRFLFAYSGHGMESGRTGYLLTSQARNLQDRGRSINLATVKVFVDEVVRDAHHTLVLLNACYGGAFLRRAFGENSWIPRNPGAHAITAGAARELTWASGGPGKGSDFFEKLFAGLYGQADTQPIARAGKPAGDGLITAEELFVYIKTEIQLLSDQRQNPQMGDISIDQSLGGFFFLNRRRQVEGGVVPGWKPTVSMGTPHELPPIITPPEPRYDIEWKSADELGRPYSQLFTHTSENRHNIGAKNASGIYRLRDSKGNIQRVEFHHSGEFCGWNYNPDGGYGGNTVIVEGGRAFSWKRRWDGKPCTENYEAFYDLPVRVCVENCE